MYTHAYGFRIEYCVKTTFENCPPLLWRGEKGEAKLGKVKKVRKVRQLR